MYRAVLAIFLATVVAAQKFNISALYAENGKIYQMRAWYGDGNLYVGPRIPAGIQNAFNITSKFAPDEYPPQHISLLGRLLFVEAITFRPQ